MGTDNGSHGVYTDWTGACLLLLLLLQFQLAGLGELLPAALQESADQIQIAVHARGTRWTVAMEVAQPPVGALAQLVYLQLSLPRAQQIHPTGISAVVEAKADDIDCQTKQFGAAAVDELPRQSGGLQSRMPDANEQ